MANHFHSEAYTGLVSILITARKHRKLTQQVVADRLGKPQSYVAKVEGGERRLDILEFIELAKALEIDPIELFTEVVDAL